MARFTGSLLENLWLGTVTLGTWAIGSYYYKEATKSLETDYQDWTAELETWKKNPHQSVYDFACEFYSRARDPEQALDVYRLQRAGRRYLSNLDNAPTWFVGSQHWKTGFECCLVTMPLNVLHSVHGDLAKKMPHLKWARVLDSHEAHGTDPALRVLKKVGRRSRSSSALTIRDDAYRDKISEKFPGLKSFCADICRDAPYSKHADMWRRRLGCSRLGKPDDV